MKQAIQVVLAAIEQGDSDELSRLVGADSHILTDEFWSETPPLIVAVKAGKPAIVELLLKAGADVNAPDATGCTALCYAVEEGVPVEIPSLLLDAGADVSTRCGFSGSQAIHIAAGANNAQALALLLRHGADKNAPDDEQATPLFFSARNGCAAVSYLLMLQGADPSRRNFEGYTPLFMAAQTRGDSGETCGVLLRYGAELDVHTAMLLGMTPIVEGLLAVNPTLLHEEPNVADFLTTAVWTQKVEFVKLLLKHGLDVNASKRYSLPLLETVRRIPADSTGPYVQIAELLLRAGANPHAKSPNDDLSAFEWAQRNNPSLLALFAEQR